ncbi:SDR family oxidoreductase [Phycisphaera mikurensis]|uniref:Putative oxidoreductase n=1 Tax=Phycisphaera mikurensis (strain NBRC 102666 / KCTC 22515 / FYK2301M01) TaxID=1142394 RepID=I0IHM6_PHYMF|nr:SDR family oxidoreductase [Phycisphaera mikurensis]MBB6441009.1 NAD(P)-dependent dehydrogenase (short-subunit alcohol dehydrogenase family) [Phycisphaera mikurensis]BAM04764.1 putative oxidoreductase [Phycisphaera mikurensis NBRC 102666]
MTDAASPRKSVLVTGAGSGIGRDTAMLLAESGYAVALAGRTLEKLEAAAALVREEVRPEAEVLPIVADVTDRAAVDAAVQQTVAAFGRLDAVVNAAGQAPLAAIERIQDAELDACVDVNLKALVYLARAAWPAFRANGREDAGVLVGISAMAIHTPHQKFSFYAAAKAGVEAFVANAATEGQRLGIRTYAVAPGAVETALLRGNFSERAIPPEKALDPISVAGVIHDLVTGEREEASGSTIKLPSP